MRALGRLLAFRLFAASTILLPFLAAPATVQAREGKPLAATYANGRLALTIPYHTDRAGSGQLVVELLDPEDKVLGRSARSYDVDKGDGVLEPYLTPDEKLSLDDLVWERLRFRFAYRGESDAAFEGIKSISQILRRPQVHVLGQRSYLSGGKAAIRIIATDSSGEAIAGRSSARVELLGAGASPLLLFHGELNRRGTAEAQFQYPAGVSGACRLHYIVDTPIGSAETTQAVTLEEKASILLTTEKPIYQPGQTIHARALALDRADHNADKDRKLTFELEDSKGNKVFKKATQTDNFGIASAEFGLADEVNLGTYHLRALMGNGTATNTAEIALNVERYVLPKFKVAIDFDEKDHKPKRDYRPGDHVTGIIHANYFFGKPVENAEVSIKASTMDVSMVEAATAQGKTDKDGSYRFDLKLPDYFAGKPISQGAAQVLVEATAKDATQHSETRGEPITVSQSSLLITAVPEGGSLIPKLDNEVFVLTSYPDGTPASTQLTLHFDMAPEQKVTTDRGGVAIVHTRGIAGYDTLHVEAQDQRGNRASSDIRLEGKSGEDQILLRTQQAVYRAGERMQLDVFSTKTQGTAYLDIVKDGQTVMTRDVDLEGGRAELSVPVTPDMAGTLDLNAYLFGRDARTAGDHRLIFVQPADDLKMEAVADAPMYKPGAEANIHFHVTNAHGEGVRAALGVQVVDEAVFALAEKQPEFAKVFFYLEQEAMKPRYEIHSLSMNDVVLPMTFGAVEQQNRAARALFAATEIAQSNGAQTDFGATVPTASFTAFQNRYHEAFLAQVRSIAAQLTEAFAGRPSNFDPVREFDRLKTRDTAKLQDAWGLPLRIQPAAWSRGNLRYYRVESAGSDQRFYSSDDLFAYIEVHTGLAPSASTQNSSVTVTIEHDRGPVNGLCNVTGTVMDQSGAVIPNAGVELTARADGKVRKALADVNGQFTLSAIPAGKYNVRVEAQGFKQVAQDFEVSAQDLAELEVRLNIGEVSQSVTVSAEAIPMPPVKQRAMGAVGAMGFGPGRAGAVGSPMAKMARPPASASTTVNVVSNGMLDLAVDKASVSSALPSAGPDAAPTHVRSYFPEALYINPEIITDGKGDANITIPIADSITTWRMAMIASTEAGALGTGDATLKVFQDFFVDLDLPVTLTQGDRVSIPIAIYNYSGERGEVSLKLQPEDWYSLVNDNADKSISVEPGHPGGSQFTLEANRIGKFKLTLSAAINGGAKREDRVVREIEVVPNGCEQSVVFNGHLDDHADSGVEHQFKFPANSIPEASKIVVRLYPGPLSQVIEGMDSILRMPGGCFEQTSSSTYPNVLALDYMKRTKKLTPEVHAKAEAYIANGYQRLLTFEVPGGGFSWFGNPPANKILTAYGLMEFSDMGKVYDVDPKVIERTQQWLADRQQADGSWIPDTQFINEGATNRFNSDVLRITAYLAWSLANTGYKGPAVEKAERYVISHMSGKADAYTLAVIANFAVEYAKDRDFTQQAMQLLLDAGTEMGDVVSWHADETGVYSRGESAAIEATGLAAQALLKWGQDARTARKALNYITSKKDATGAWGSTQATIMALRAVLLASEIGTSDVTGSVEVSLNGTTVETLALTPQNNDLLHQFVLKNLHAADLNSVQIHFSGTGGLAYQVSGHYFVPWQARPDKEALSIDVAYDRTKLAQNDIATATATVKSNLDRTAKMVMVDLGIPPGFDLLSEDLQDLQEKSAEKPTGRLEKFSLTATQAILYFNALGPHETVELKFRLRAKYPIRAKTFESRVYEYYDPAVTASARPMQLEVTDR
jgi:uncharacterized protein YfaS (alpha-2-macroglobulin family)